MTADKLCSECIAILKRSGIESAEFEAACLLESYCKVTKLALRLTTEMPCRENEAKNLLAAAEKRAAGYPLQYLLGEWEFYSKSFYVGEGVLIPRPETELLVDTVLAKTSSIYKPTVVDLCAGSGCIGISIALHSDAAVYAIEKSPNAFSYLTKNIEKHAKQRVKAVNADIFDGFDKLMLPMADVIVSNPPYIKTSELASLQREVGFEPQMALNGGEDGLIFYRVIAEKWLSLIKPGGFLAVECGEDHANAVAAIFAAKLNDVQVKKDYCGNDRIVTAIKCNT